MLKKILPESADKRYTGYKAALWFFMLISIVSTVRSLIHIFLPDGGAGSIAGLDLSAGKANILFSFGLWGVSQLIYALLQLLVAFRYRSLIPLLYIVLIVETVGRMWVGFAKPPVVFHTPPGGIGNRVLLPLAAVMLVLSLLEPKAKRRL